MNDIQTVLNQLRADILELAKLMHDAIETIKANDDDTRGDLIFIQEQIEQNILRGN